MKSSGRLLRWLWTLVFWTFALTLLLVFWMALRYTIPWWFVSMIPAVLVAYWMWRVGIPRGRKRIYIGTMLISSSIIALLRGYFTPPPYIPEDTHPAVLEYSMGELPVVDGFYDLKDSTEDRYVVFMPGNDSDEIELDVFFDPVYSYGGEWAAVSVSTSVGCATSDGCDVAARDPSATGKPVGWTWGSDMKTNLESSDPSVKVELPLYESDVHRWMSFSVTADVIFPSAISNADETEPRARKMQIFVGTPEEFQTRIRYNRWKELETMMTESPSTVGIYAFMFTGVLFAGWGYLASSGGVFTGVQTPYYQARRSLKLITIDEAALLGIGIRNLPEAGAVIEAIAIQSTFDFYDRFSVGNVIVRIEDQDVKRPADVNRILWKLGDRRFVTFTLWDGEKESDIVLDFASPYARQH